MKIDPKRIEGPWDEGYVLDRHTISSTMIGYNEFGHPEFDTLRSELGELLYRLKYQSDMTAVAPIAETVADFVKQWGIKPDVIVTMPPSKPRLRQPLFEIGAALSNLLGVPLDTKSVSKTQTTPQMKDVGDFAARVKVLQGTIAVVPGLRDKAVLLVDDLYQSGASMGVVAEALQQAHVRSVFCVALTRTRS